MATSISKAVPRSRLNIKYRTRIDGQVVPKELPLRLLIAGDFSGRAKGLGTAKPKPLPPLAQRTIYSIGKESTLEGVLGRARISLPIPTTLTTERDVALVGHATVRVVKTNVSGVEQYLLSIKSSLIDNAVELVREAQVSNPPAPSVVTRDTKLFQGEVLALGSVAISQATALPTMPQGDSNAPASETLEKWRLGQPAMELSRVWQTMSAVEVCGNIAAAVSPAGEPPDLLEVFGKALVFFQFDDDLSALLLGDSRDAIEFRVRVMVPKATARRAVQLANMSSLLPGRVAMSVPNIRRLLVVRWLLSQGRSMIGSNPALRTQVKDMLNAEKDRVESVPKILATLTQTDVDAQKKYATTLLDKAAAPSEAPEKTYAAPLRALVEKRRRQEPGIPIAQRYRHQSVVGRVDGRKQTACGETDETKKQALAEQLAKLESPWDTIVTSVAGLGLDKFVIKGAGK